MPPTARFTARTQGDLARLRQLVHRVQEREEALQQIQHLAHRICGTGTTLGLAALSERAGELEQLAKTETSGEVTGSSMSAAGLDTEEYLSSHLGRLAQELEAAAASA